MADRRETLKQSTPSAVSLRVRPFGYALCAVTWLVLFLVVVGMSLGALPLAFAEMGPLQASDGVAKALADPAEGLAAIAVLLLMPFIWGGLFAWILVVTGAMTALSVLFVVRALNRDFAGEKLSFSTMDDAVMGGPSPGGVAMSLQPVRSTPASDVLIRAYWAGWKPNVNLYLSATILGGAYLFTVAWVFWPVDGLLWQLLCGVITVTLTVWGAWRYRRALLGRPLPGYFGR